MGTREDALEVFDAWRARQALPAACRWTPKREELVRRRLGAGFSVDDLSTLVRYAYDADEAGPRWWRGGNPDGRRYLDLESLLRDEKLPGRVQAAIEWAARTPVTPPGQPAPQSPGAGVQGRARAVHR